MNIMTDIIVKWIGGLRINNYFCGKCIYNE